MRTFRKNPFFKAALLTFLLPGIWGIITGPFLIFGKRAEGTVISMKFHPGSRFNHKTSISAYWTRVVQYPTENGQVLETDAQDDSVFVGDRVGVYYLPGTSRARLTTFNGLWSLLVFTLGLQVVPLTVFGMLGFWFSQNPRLNRLAPFGFPILFVFIGVLSAYPGYQRAQFLSQGVYTTGAIVLEPVYAPKDKHYPVVQYVAKDGQTYKTESLSYKKGAKVKVIYLPQHPQSAMVLSNGEVPDSEQWWFLPLMFTGLPTLLSLAVIVGLWTKEPAA
jgi:hypothetical protein